MESVPLDFLITTPLLSACDAQTRLAETAINFIDSVAYDSNGNVRNVNFATTTTKTDASGNVVSTTTNTNIPLVTMVNLPCLYIQKVSIDLTVEVNAMSKKSSDSSSQQTRTTNASANVKYGIGAFSASAHADYSTTCKLSSQNTAQNSLSTHAIYVLHVEATNEKPSGIVKMLDYLTNNS